MSLVLVRIDDRLIHGQVTVGWGSFLSPDKILLVSDEIATNEWEKELYEKCVPFNVKISILSVKDAVEGLINNIYEDERVILLAESPAAIVELVNLGAVFQQVNIGGMHYKESKRKILPYVYVDEQDIQDFRFLEEHNIELICQDLPQAKKENLSELLT
ncbi:PTS sugar transporter subunit IIB [candidate division KSB1 bacterium]|nr:PTS sugar transporter subunit IIB [candidate division KSB1 bacterium]